MKIIKKSKIKRNHSKNKISFTPQILEQNSTLSDAFKKLDNETDEQKL